MKKQGKFTVLQGKSWPLTTIPTMLAFTILGALDDYGMYEDQGEKSIGRQKSTWGKNDWPPRKIEITWRVVK